MGAHGIIKGVARMQTSDDCRPYRQAAIELLRWWRLLLPHIIHSRFMTAGSQCTPHIYIYRGGVRHFHNAHDSTRQLHDWYNMIPPCHQGALRFNLFCHPQTHTFRTHGMWETSHSAALFALWIIMINQVFRFVARPFLRRCRYIRLSPSWMNWRASTRMRK